MGKFKQLAKCICCGHCIVSKDGKIAYCVKFGEYIGNKNWKIFCDDFIKEKSKMLKKIIELSNKEIEKEGEK